MINSININSLEEYEEVYSNVIKVRGRDYYKKGKVLSCIKSDNIFYAKVEGSCNSVYNVEIEIKDNSIVTVCTCPCEYPCKHEYATLIGIKNLEYESLNLLPKIEETETDLELILNQIPAEEIKEYLLSEIGLHKVAFEMDTFNSYFKNYIPKQSYEYYYNNLYNDILLEEENTLTKYINNIKEYIKKEDYKEVFKILNAIIEAFNDTDMLNYLSDLTNLFPSLGMYLRIIYRKSNSSLQTEINTWITHLEKNNYYNNIYLEDIVLGIK